MLLSLIDDHGNDDAAVAEILLAVAHEEEEYEAFLAASSESIPDCAEESPDQNSFELLVNECDAGVFYTEEFARTDLDRVMNNFSCDTFIVSCPNEDTSSCTTALKTDHSSSDIPTATFNTFHVPDSFSNLEFFGKSLHHEFIGALLDTGAQRSVIGVNQAREYCVVVGIDLNLQRSGHHFTFGAGEAKSLGKLRILVSTPGSTLSLLVDVVRPNIPFLLGLDVLDEYGLQVLSYENLLQCVTEGWKTPTVRKLGHIYLEWSASFKAFLSKPQLDRLHRHLMHPSTIKLYELLSRAAPEHLTPDTRQLLQEVSSACETCSVYSKRQISFRIRENGETRFNQRVMIDIMYLDTSTTKKQPVLHVVDSANNFQNAAFIRDNSSSTV